MMFLLQRLFLIEEALVSLLLLIEETAMVPFFCSSRAPCSCRHC
jgi:hypothetical protein